MTHDSRSREEQDLHVFDLPRTWVEAGYDFVAKLFALLFRVRRSRADVEDVGFAVVLERQLIRHWISRLTA